MMPRSEDAPRLKLERVPGRSGKPLPSVRRLLQKVLADVEDGGQAIDDGGQDREVLEASGQPRHADEV